MKRPNQLLIRGNIEALHQCNVFWVWGSVHMYYGEDTFVLLKCDVTVRKRVELEIDETVVKTESYGRKAETFNVVIVLRFNVGLVS